MIALVHLPIRFCGQGVAWVELQDIDAGIGEGAETFRRRAESAHAVTNRVYLYTFLLLGDQGGDETLSDFVVAKDVGPRVDVVTGYADG